MKVPITKSGNCITNNFYESSAIQIAYNQEQGDRDKPYAYTFKPSRNNNSSISISPVHIDGNTGLYRVMLKVEWVGFDTSNTDGTFDIYFQGDVWRYSVGAWSWSSGMSNYMINPLRTQQNLKNLVLSSESGSYNFNTTFNVLDADCYMLRLGMRSNYSNGMGTITVSDIQVMPEKYYTGGNEKLRAGEDYVACNNFIEI
ncbi:MAG: hypothetical protein PHC62_00305 [Candidatus Izemoplasmatales bacterium]|nr:hypothetical protein [Candidatus Izemoplasmatales bacterium]